MTNKEAIFKLIKYRRRLDEEYTIDDEPFDMAIEALQEQKTGKWKLLRKGNDTSDYECTNCRGILMDVANDDHHELQRYCGMCGARMIGEEE